MQQQAYHQLKIVRIIIEAGDAKSFELQPLGQWQPTYKAGQFLTIVFQNRHGEKRRSYSFSSSPALNEPLCITVKRVENGEFSRLLLSHAKVGDILHTAGISGLFLLPADMREMDQFFFLAAGSGITPCFSLIKTLLKTTNKKVVLIYSNRSQQETIFFQQINLLRQQHEQQFQIHFLYSNNTGLYTGRLSNFLLQDLLEQYLLAQKDRVLFYLCGPFGYMQTMSIGLLSAGIPQPHIRKENFNTLPVTVKPVPPDTASHAVTIHFKNGNKRIPVQFPDSILAAAKAHDIRIPYSCEAGRCGSCVATCIKGRVWMAYNEVLMDDEIAKGKILCCQAYPVDGDVEIVVE